MKKLFKFILLLILASLCAAAYVMFYRSDTPIGKWLNEQYEHYLRPYIPSSSPAPVASEGAADEVVEKVDAVETTAEPEVAPPPPVVKSSVTPPSAPKVVAKSSPTKPVADVSASKGVDEPQAEPKKKSKPFAKENWYAGKRLTASDVRNKTVLVYLFDVEDERSVAMLTRVQRTWEGFKHKPFTVIGSHRGARSNKVLKTIKAKKVTFPVYQDAYLPNEPATIPELPYFYVIKPNGRLGYCGVGDMEATEAVVNSISNSIGK